MASRLHAAGHSERLVAGSILRVAVRGHVNGDVDYGLRVVLTVKGGIAAENSRPAMSAELAVILSRTLDLTGVTVVSSHPQSTTSPVIRPQAVKASKAEGVNDIDGTCCQCPPGWTPVRTYLEVLE